MAKIDLEFDGFSALKITQNIDTVSDEFSMEMLQSHANLDIFYPFAYTPITLEFAGFLALTGRVIATSARRSANSIGITAQGVSLAAALVQSTITSIYKTNISFENLVRYICSFFQLQVVCTIPTPMIPVAECQTGTNAFGFLNGYAKDFNLLLQSNEYGAVVISSQEPDKTSAIMLSTDNSLGAELSVNYDGSKFGRTYIASGQIQDINVFGQFNYERVPYTCLKHIQTDINPEKKIRWQLVRDNVDANLVSLSMPNWSIPGGRFFQRGAIFKLHFPEIWLDGYYRARRTSFELSSSSRKTNFALERIFQ